MNTEILQVLENRLDYKYEQQDGNDLIYYCKLKQIENDVQSIINTEKLEIPSHISEKIKTIRSLSSVLYRIIIDTVKPLPFNTIDALVSETKYVLTQPTNDKKKYTDQLRNLKNHITRKLPDLNHVCMYEDIKVEVYKKRLGTELYDQYTLLLDVIYKYDFSFKFGAFYHQEFKPMITSLNSYISKDSYIDDALFKQVFVCIESFTGYSSPHGSKHFSEYIRTNPKASHLLNRVRIVEKNKIPLSGFPLILWIIQHIQYPRTEIPIFVKYYAKCAEFCMLSVRKCLVNISISKLYSTDIRSIFEPCIQQSQEMIQRCTQLLVVYNDIFNDPTYNELVNIVKYQSSNIGRISKLQMILIDYKMILTDPIFTTQTVSTVYQNMDIFNIQNFKQDFKFKNHAINLFVPLWWSSGRESIIPILRNLEKHILNTINKSV